MKLLYMLTYVQHQTDTKLKYNLAILKGVVF